MIKNHVFGEKTTNGREIAFLLTSAILPLLAIMIAVLFGGILGTFDTSKSAAVIGALIFIIFLTLRQYELAAAGVLMVRVYVDWYLGLGIVAQVMAIILLAMLFTFRGTRYSSRFPKALWLWVLFLLIAMIPATRGVTLLDSIYYYSNVIFSAFIMYWLGIVIARDPTHVRRLLMVLSCLATFLAIVTIIQTLTGKLLFGTTNYDAYLASIGNYALSSDTNISRTGGFFVNPNGSGGFFAMMLLIPLGLFLESSTALEKALYLIEVFILLPALVFSFSTESWLSLIIGGVVFLALIGRASYRFLLFCIIAGITVIMLTVFPSQVVLQIQHAEQPSELVLRSGAWQTAVQVIRAFPLLGLGLGRHVYLLRADPYRVIAQYRPLDHPHDSYLELAALGGIPIALLFIVLLFLAFWLALRNWFRSDMKTRPLIAGGIASAAALSVFSLSDAGWTTAPLLAIGWLILGAISTPIRSTSQVGEIFKEKGKKLLG